MQNIKLVSEKSNTGVFSKIKDLLNPIWNNKLRLSLAFVTALGSSTMVNCGNSVTKTNPSALLGMLQSVSEDFYLIQSQPTWTVAPLADIGGQRTMYVGNSNLNWYAQGDVMEGVGYDGDNNTGNNTTVISGTINTQGRLFNGASAPLTQLGMNAAQSGNTRSMRYKNYGAGTYNTNLNGWSLNPRNSFNAQVNGNSIQTYDSEFIITVDGDPFLQGGSGLGITMRDKHVLTKAWLVEGGTSVQSLNPWEVFSNLASSSDPYRLNRIGQNYRQFNFSQAFVLSEIADFNKHPQGIHLRLQFEYGDPIDIKFTPSVASRIRSQAIGTNSPGTAPTQPTPVYSSTGLQFPTAAKTVGTSIRPANANNNYMIRINLDTSLGANSLMTTGNQFVMVWVDDPANVPDPLPVAYRTYNSNLSTAATNFLEMYGPDQVSGSNPVSGGLTTLFMPRPTVEGAGGIASRGDLQLDRLSAAQLNTINTTNSGQIHFVMYDSAGNLQIVVPIYVADPMTTPNEINNPMAKDALH